MNLRTSLSALAIVGLLPFSAFAAGGDEPAPQPTQTTKECKKGKVWSEKKKRCVNPDNAHLGDDVLYGAVREFAYAGQLENAQRALSAMSNQNEDRVLTYWGFTHRKMGHAELGMAFYEKALSANPDNYLARSYKGQAHVEAGDLVLARSELVQIRKRGGAGTWAEQSLASAIETGVTYDF